jgi:photosystem II stability/assembly factor-like uncharacterized protein
MMKKISVLFVIFGVLIFSTNGVSQTWERFTKKERTRFKDIQEATYKFYESMGTKRKPGFTQFKRWEWFARQRLDKDGYFDMTHQYRAWLEKEERFGPPEKSRVYGADWIARGPFTPDGISGVGRLNCVAFDPQDSNIMWVGAPTGGLWKSTDAGQSWTTATDNLPNLGVSDVAIHPADSSIMYIATGDKQRGSALSYGVLKSTDGGQTWDFTSLRPQVEEKYKIGKLIMHPADPETLLCATNKGVYKTMDGGDTWELKQEGDFFDLEVHPFHSRMWYATRSKNGVYRSIDSGESWVRLSNGLPNASAGIGRIAVALSPSEPGMIYALYTTDTVGQGWVWGLYGIFRSLDDGATWQQRRGGYPNILGWEADGSDAGGQGGYALVFQVNPTNPDILIAGSVNLWKSTSGGSTWRLLAHWTGSGAARLHADQHELAYLPGSGNTLFACHDGGLHRSDNDGANWTDLSGGLAIHQVYRVAPSTMEPAYFALGAQDNGSSYFRGQWNTLSGGDGMDCMIDPGDPNTVYSSSQRGYIYRTRSAGSNSVNVFGDVSGASTWLTPLAMDPFDPTIVYTASTRVYRSTDRGTSSSAISPVFTGQSITVLKIAPSNGNVIAVSDGFRVFETSNGGDTWDELDNSLFPTFITDLAFHPQNPDILWLTVGGYGRWHSKFLWYDLPYETDKPKIFQTTDSGMTWTDVSGQIPNVPANCVTVDPHTLGVFLGTDLGIFYSASGSGDWVRYDNGLPNVIVTDMDVVAGAGKILAATYGRGVWESPLAVSPAVYPPLQFSGRQVVNQSFLQSEYINLLDWSANPRNMNGSGNDIVAVYRLYEGAGSARTLLAELPGNVFEYMHRGMENRSYRYTLIAVDNQGIESLPAVLSVEAFIIL